ncbi:serine-rich adhesin for platelets-like, partial [Aphis craccivora]
GNKCCLEYCTSISYLHNKKGIRFHRFPKKLASEFIPIILLTKFRCAIWIEKCNPIHLPSRDPLVLCKTYRLCSLHFEDKMYTDSNKNKLRAMAIPTLFKENITVIETDVSSFELINNDDNFNENNSVDNLPNCSTSLSTSSFIVDPSTLLPMATYQTPNEDSEVTLVSTNTFFVDPSTLTPMATYQTPNEDGEVTLGELFLKYMVKKCTA